MTSFSNLLFPSSTKDNFLNETVIPIKSIAYIQIGSEDLEEGHQQLAESLRTISAYVFEALKMAATNDM